MMATMPIDSRVLLVEHPEFGVANPDKGVRLIRGNQGHVSIGGYWGSWDTYANLPAKEVVVTESWFCVQDMGYRTDCGDPATEERGGFPYCERHARILDLFEQWDAERPADEDDVANPAPTIEPETMRTAVARDAKAKVETIRRYLPSNYTCYVSGEDVWIVGVDRFGWTLDDYVLPRLASGLHMAEEVTDR